MIANETTLFFGGNCRMRVDQFRVGTVEMSIETESEDGSGWVRLRIIGDDHEYVVEMNPDHVLTLAEVLTVYANSSKRVTASPPGPPSGPPSVPMPEPKSGTRPRRRS